MIIYQKTKQFNQNTGKPFYVNRYKEHRDDFTGDVLTDETLYVEYNLNYADRDPCFGSGGEEFDFGVKYNIDVYQFLSESYHFDNLINQSELMMMKSFLEKEGILSFADMCRLSRIRTAASLIKLEFIKPENLLPEYDY